MALADFDRAIELDPTSADTYYTRGMTYLILKQNQKAITNFDRALLIDPDLTDAQEAREKASRLLKDQ